MIWVVASSDLSAHVRQRVPGRQALRWSRLSELSALISPLFPVRI